MTNRVTKGKVVKSIISRRIKLDPEDYIERSGKRLTIKFTDGTSLICNFSPADFGDGTCGVREHFEYKIQ